MKTVIPEFVDSIPYGEGKREITLERPNLMPWDHDGLPGQGELVYVACWAEDEKSVKAIDALFKWMGLSHTTNTDAVLIEKDGVRRFALLRDWFGRIVPTDDHWGRVVEHEFFFQIENMGGQIIRKKNPLGELVLSASYGEDTIEAWVGPDFPEEGWAIEDPSPPDAKNVGEVLVPSRNDRRSDKFYYADIRRGVIYFETRNFHNRRTGEWDRLHGGFKPISLDPSDMHWEVYSADDARALAKLLNDAADALDSEDPPG